mmetsp:Transcript_72430/g.212526  ORF Transcript_72430/g.212526 Transcript_72430/m.212526 type:complete len:250 (-) Transcript_72430:400-1149(-)
MGPCDVAGRGGRSARPASRDLQESPDRSFSTRVCMTLSLSSKAATAATAATQRCWQPSSDQTAPPAGARDGGRDGGPPAFSVEPATRAKPSALSNAWLSSAASRLSKSPAACRTVSRCGAASSSRSSAPADGSSEGLAAASPRASTLRLSRSSLPSEVASAPSAPPSSRETICGTACSSASARRCCAASPLVNSPCRDASRSYRPAKALSWDFRARSMPCWSPIRRASSRERSASLSSVAGSAGLTSSA